MVPTAATLICGLLLPACIVCNPEDWFLSASELSEDMCGYNRSETRGCFPSIAPWTDGNKVTFMIDGRSFFELLKKDIDATKRDDRILGNAWTFSPFVEMDPEKGGHGKWYDCKKGTLSFLCQKHLFCSLDLKLVSGDIGNGSDSDHVCCHNPLDSECTSVGGVLGRAAERGVNVQLLTWKNGFPGTNGGAYLEFAQGMMNDIFFKTESKSVMVFDKRQPGPMGSIHQKAYSIVRDDRVTVSYVSGWDVAKCRYDETDARGWGSTVVGDSVETRARRLFVIEGCSGWLDEGVRLEGPAAADVANTFVQRWNWNTSLRVSQQSPDEAEFEKRRSVELGTEKAGEPAGDQYVQVLRTYPCEYSPFAPCGERSILNAILKAVKRSRRFIFIEDQYGFHVEVIREALDDALDRGVQVVVLMNMFGAGMNFYCKGNGDTMWNNLIDKGASVFEYNKARYKDYVHSKTWIVDDCWLLSGSANLNRRSLTADPELSVAVLDRTCNQFHNGVHIANIIKRARCMMWAELDSVEHHNTTEICDLKDESASDMKKVIRKLMGTTEEPRASKLRGLDTYRDNNRLYGQPLSLMTSEMCSQTDIEGQCGATSFWLTPFMLVTYGVTIIFTLLLVCCIIRCCRTCCGKQPADTNTYSPIG